MKMLNVPVTNMTNLKKSPAQVIQQAQDSKNGVYVFNRDKPAAVIMTPNDYEELLQKIDYLEDQILDYQVERTAKNRLKQGTNQTYRPEEIFGQKWDQDLGSEEDDGWE